MKQRMFSILFAACCVSGVTAFQPAHAADSATTSVTDANGLTFSLETKGKPIYRIPKGKNVFVVFRGSAELSYLIGRSLQANGSRMVNDRSEADVVVEAQAFFQADRGTRHISGHVGSAMADQLTPLGNGNQGSLDFTSKRSLVASLAGAMANSILSDDNNQKVRVVDGKSEGYCLLGCDFKQKLDFELWISGTDVPADYGYTSYVMRTKDSTLRANEMVVDAIQRALGQMGGLHD